jgi:hypothetical protein
MDLLGTLIVVAGVVYFVILLVRLFNEKAAERRLKRQERERLAEWKREEEAEKAEWDAFVNWARQNPATAERLMLIVENEQISDPDYRAWIAERRAAKGPDILTDLPRLFNWLKAQRDLKKFGLGTDLPLSF